MLEIKKVVILLVRIVMNNSGSMERALTTKSVSQFNLRQICQWTAATSLVAAGSIALFSANTLEKLNQNGEVSIDLSAFTKLSSATIALDRTAEETLLVEDDRILEQSLFAQAEALPRVHTHFKPFSRVIREKLTPQEAEEISQLEHVRDPALESEAIAGIYRRVRFKFLAAADRTDFSEAPTTVASTEFETKLKASSGIHATHEVPIADSSHLQVVDEVETSASVGVVRSEMPPPPELTAKPEVTSSALKGEAPARVDINGSDLKIITTANIDAVPTLIETLKVDSQPKTTVTTQSNEVKVATGPPEHSREPVNIPNSVLRAVGPPPIESAPEVSSPVADIPQAIPSDYSADVASIYDMQPDDSLEQENEYSKDSEYSARPKVSNEPVTVVTTHQPSPTTPKNYGNGISKDEKGISIDWAKKRDSRIYVGNPGEPVPALKPEPLNSAFAQSLSKFSFGPPPASPVTAAPTPAVELDLKKCETARFGVEAFNPGAEKEAISICLRVLSQEGEKDGTQAKWWESYGTEKEHWPTLAFLKQSQISEKNRIPMLSNASIRILSLSSKTNTHTGTGILFGEIPRGLEITLLGRSDAPIYLDGGTKVSEPNSDPQNSRQFVFLNVQPGQPLLLVKDGQKNQTGALPLVIKAGMATYLKVPELKIMDLNFTLLDASSSKQKRLSGLTGEIVGQPGKMGISDAHGLLRISKVVGFSGYPLYIDILRNEEGYRNRHRVRSEDRELKSGPSPLYFFDEKRVANWLKQLMGGVSPSSGLIVGALPRAALTERKLLEKNSKVDRTLRIGTLEKKSTLVPERYVLGAEDRLEIRSSLNAEDTRFLGVQIPEGAVIPSLIDENGELLWSEIVYAQPGVINVVGP